MVRQKNNTTIPLKVLFSVVCLLGLLHSTHDQLSAGSAISTDNVRDWKFWKYEDLKSLDPWGDSNGDARDLVAVYEKEVGDTISFRVDVLDTRIDSSLNVFFAIDYKPGGKTELVKNKPGLVSDISWDLLVWFSDSGQKAAFDTNYVDHSTYFTHVASDHELDLIEFSILKKGALAGWDGTPFKVQAFVTDRSATSILDKTVPASTEAGVGRGKLVLAFGNMFAGYGPHAVSWYDGFAFTPPERQGERTGLRYLLDAIETYELPLTTNDMRVDVLAANDYLGINDRLRSLARRGLLDPLSTLTYGYFMPWQPADVDAMAFRIARQTWDDFGLPQSQVFYPYEAMLTAGDLEVIKQAGYSAVFALDRYGYWFGLINDWSNQDEVQSWYRNSRKIHRVNGVLVLPGLQGYGWDPRWNQTPIEPGWHLNRYDSYEGTDGGLHHGWRRVLLDMALDPDQEQYITMGTDLTLTPWFLPGGAERSARWIAHHPWIEATTFDDLLQKNWAPVDHGDLGLTHDQPLERYPATDDMHYNAYFWQFYYGGISDGHSPLIPAGTKIEGYFDYVPYLRNGRPIPSGRKMGDDHTPGAIVYETLRNLRTAPDNSLTRLAWLAYFMNIAEQTFHAQTNYQSGATPGGDWGGPYLHPGAKIKANHLGQVNKIVAAAQWADEAAKGALPDSAQLLIQDLDLDGEDEYVLQNDKVFTIFENDAGRMEYAFACDPAAAPVQLVAPIYQLALDWDLDYKEGELPQTSPPLPESAFAEVDSFLYNIYDVALGDGRLTFISPDRQIRKTFTLEDNTIHAHYSTGKLGDIAVTFALPINMANMFSQNWWEKLEKIESSGSVGWKVSAGGYTAVNLMDTRLNSADSFTDSPAREEMRERADPSTYPSGHWLFFPYNTITVIGNGEFDVSLTLSVELPTPVEQFVEKVPREYAIYQNYPNPFNPETVIEYQLPRDSEVEISILNLRGQKVATLVQDHQTAGTHKIIWNGMDESGQSMPAGVYFNQLKAGKIVQVKKMVLLR